MNALSARVAGIFAILFVVLMVVGSFIGFNTPGGEDPDQDWLDYFEDDEKMVMAIVSAYLIVLAAIAFLVFAVAMYQRFRAAEEGNSGLPLLMLVMSVGWAVPLAIGGLLTAAIAGGIKLGGASDPSPDVARWIDQLGFGIMLVAGGLSAAAMAAVTGILIMRTKALPAWLGYFAFVAALAMCAAAIFIPMIIFALWMLVMGIVLVSRAGEGDRAPAASV